MVHVIALIKNAETLVGIRLLDKKSLAVGDFKLEEALKHMNTYGCSNAGFINGKLECNDCSVDRMPVLNTNLEVVKNKGLIILAEEIGGDTTYYIVCDILGVIKRLDKAELACLINLEEKTQLAQGIKDPVVLVNGKLFEHNGRLIMASIRGHFEQIETKDKVYRVEVRKAPKLKEISMLEFKDMQIREDNHESAIAERLRSVKYAKALGISKYATDSEIISKYRKYIKSNGKATEFTESYVGTKFAVAYGIIKDESGSCYKVVDGGAPRGECRMGLAKTSNGELVIPCWFDILYNRIWNVDVNIVELAVNKKDIQKYRPEMGIINEEAWCGFINLVTRKITKISYSFSTIHKDRCIRQNIFTGDTVDIRKVLENSTETLDDLLAYVPKYQR